MIVVNVDVDVDVDDVQVDEALTKLDVPFDADDVEERTRQLLGTGDRAWCVVMSTEPSAVGLFMQ